MASITIAVLSSCASLYDWTGKNAIIIALQLLNNADTLRELICWVGGGLFRLAKEAFDQCSRSLQTIHYWRLNNNDDIELRDAEPVVVTVGQRTSSESQQGLID